MALDPSPKFFTKSKNNKESGVTIDFVNEKVVIPLEVVLDKVLKLMALRGSSDASASLAYELIAATRDNARGILGQATASPEASHSEVEAQGPGHSL